MTAEQVARDLAQHSTYLTPRDIAQYIGCGITISTVRQMMHSRGFPLQPRVTTGLKRQLRVHKGDFAVWYAERQK
jgi:hypothetical protein